MAKDEVEDWKRENAVYCQLCCVVCCHLGRIVVGKSGFLVVVGIRRSVCSDSLLGKAVDSPNVGKYQLKVLRTAEKAKIQQNLGGRRNSRRE